MESTLSTLVEFAARLAASKPEVARRLATTLLATSGAGLSRSTLNNDASPLQLCLGLSANGAHPAVRLIADPAAELADGQQRWRQANGALSALLTSHAPELKTLCHSVIERMLPFGAAACAALPGGAFWLAANLQGQGMAIYATAKWLNDQERWTRSRQWLDTILADPSSAHQILDRLASRATLVSVGIEGTNSENARAKLYWRLDRNMALHDLEIPLFKNAAIAEFLSEAIEDRRIPRAAIVGSISFRVATGSVSDVKLDVCGHCVRRTSAHWMQTIEALIERHKLARLPASFSTVMATTELAFLGFGLDSEWQPRLNIYLKRTSPPPQEKLPGVMRDASPYAIEFGSLTTTRVSRNCVWSAS